MVMTVRVEQKSKSGTIVCFVFAFFFKIGKNIKSFLLGLNNKQVLSLAVGYNKSGDH